jgi:hypothetical protein
VGMTGRNHFRGAQGGGGGGGTPNAAVGSGPGHCAHMRALLWAGCAPAGARATCRQNSTPVSGARIQPPTPALPNTHLPTDRCGTQCLGWGGGVGRTA